MYGGVFRRRQIGHSGAGWRPSVSFNRGTAVAVEPAMLKLLGSYVIAKVLGFGIVGAIVIYLLLTMLT
jgi:hypothetical protein